MEFHDKGYGYGSILLNESQDKPRFVLRHSKLQFIYMISIQLFYFILFFPFLPFPLGERLSPCYTYYGCEMCFLFRILDEFVY